MVHHAYIKNTANRDGFRHILAAPSAHDIDEWWREQQKKGTVGMQRVSPDFYTYNTGDLLSQTPDWQPKIILTWLGNANGSGIYATGFSPSSSRTDHVSGGTFYIRSKSQPSLYWWAPTNGGRIYASRKGRTRFRISIDHDDKKEQLVMIKSDRIVLTSVKNPKLSVSTEEGVLYLGKDSDSFDFNDLKTRFLADGAFDEIAITRVELGGGEEWELVS